MSHSWATKWLGESKVPYTSEVLRNQIKPRMLLALEADMAEYGQTNDTAELSENLLDDACWLDITNGAYYCYCCFKFLFSDRPRAKNPKSVIFDCCETTFCQKCLSIIYNQKLSVKRSCHSELDSCCPICVVPNIDVDKLVLPVEQLETELEIELELELKKKLQLQLKLQLHKELQQELQQK